MITIYPHNTPIIAHIFNYPIRYYGLIMAIVFLVGVLFSYYLFKKKYNNATADLFFDYAPILIISSIIGARLFYVFASWEFYSDNLIEIFMINHGGLSIFGSIIAGLATIFIISKVKKFDFKKHLDVIAVVFPLCQAIGRFGNYFNQEAYGAPANGFIRLFVDEKFRYAQYKNIEFYHPTFLYESFFDLIIFFILMRLFFTKKQLNSGVISCLYLIFYAVVRFFIESIRLDSVLNVGNIPIVQIICIIVFIVSLFVLYFICRNKNLQY